jgi:hypothetical protein
MTKDKYDKKKRKEKKERERAARRVARDRQYRAENEDFEMYQRKAPHFKKLLRMRGYDLPFYDFLDSYADEFKNISVWARTNYLSLIKVAEVADHVFESPQDHWEELGCGGLTQLFFNHSDEFSDYGQKSAEANLAGHTIAFHDRAKSLRTLVTIKQSVKSDLKHPDYKYVLKIASLCHEIGHVHDLENGLNFRFDETITDIIEAEVFAHLFALELMAKRNLIESYKLLYGGLVDAKDCGGYLGEVCQRVLSRLPEHSFTDWRGELSVEPTLDEWRALGPTARRILSE